jgi:cobalt/nickel transport system permease protein
MITAILLIIGIILTPEGKWLAYPLLWTLLGSLAQIGRIGIWRLSWLSGLALPFILAAITLLFTTPGNIVMSIGDFSITDAGLARFLAIILKSWLSMQVALLLSITTHSTDLLWALENLRVPKILVAIISFMYRYLYTIRDEAERMIRARAARSGTSDGFKAGGQLLWRAKITGGMIGNLFLRSYERSERVYAAMCARGYTGQTIAHNAPPLKKKDIGIGGIPVLIVIIIQIAVRL